MSFWKSFSKQLPLNDSRDVLARIGVRFVWCTGPFLLIAMTLSAFGNSGMLLSPWSFFIHLIPIVGGIIDWTRIRVSIAPSPLTNH